MQHLNNNGRRSHIGVEGYTGGFVGFVVHCLLRSCMHACIYHIRSALARRPYLHHIFWCETV